MIAFFRWFPIIMQILLGVNKTSYILEESDFKLSNMLEYNGPFVSGGSSLGSETFCTEGLLINDRGLQFNKEI